MKKRFRKTKIIVSVIVFLLVVLGLGFVYLNIEYPLAYNSIIKKYAKEYDVDPYLIASIINVESSYNKEAVSPKDAKGLMQITPQTGQWASEEINMEGYTEESLFDPDTNIRIGTWYLNRLKDQFDENLDNVLIAYNAGSGNLNKWLVNKEYSKDGVNVDNIPFEETEKYLVKVKQSYKVYSKVYKKNFDQLGQDSAYIDLGNNVKKTMKELYQVIQ